MAKKDDDILNPIRMARAYEKVAIAEAKRRAEDQIRHETKEAHDKLLEAVRVALMSGQTVRQIGMAYGSSDPTTARRIVNEAMANEDGQTINPHPAWQLSRNLDGTFNIKAYSLGDSGLNGFGVFQIDEDGENFSCIDGDMFIQVQLYKLGYKDIVIAEAKGDN